MPTAAEPTPYLNQRNIEQQDYFGNRNSYVPSIPDQASPSNQADFPQTMSIARKPVGTPPSRQVSADSVVHPQKEERTLKTDSSEFHPLVQPTTKRDKALERKPVSAETGVPAEAVVSTIRFEPTNFVAQSQSFLDKPPVPSKVGDPRTRKATATSYRSASTSQVMGGRRPLGPNQGQNHRFSNPGSRISSLRDLPPIFLKDPLTARIPSGCLPSLRVVLAPPTVTEPNPVEPISSTTTSITTTTGSDRPQHDSVQPTGPVKIMNQDASDVSSQQSKSAQVSSITISQQTQKPNNTHSNMLQIHQADIVTLSASQLAPTKSRIARLCQMISAEREGQLKTTPTSTSTYPRAPGKVSSGAHTAALTAYQNSRNKAAMKRTEMQVGDRLNPNTIRVGPGDTGSHLRNQNDENCYEKSLIIGPQAGWSSNRQDDLVIWRLPPNGEQYMGRGKQRVLQLQQNTDASPVKVFNPPPNITQRYARGQTAEVVGFPIQKIPRPGLSQVHPSVKQAVTLVVQTTWWFVGPAFEPDSALRKRWEQGCLTGKDTGVLSAASLCMVVGLVMTVGVLRFAWGIFRVVKSFLELFHMI